MTLSVRNQGRVRRRRQQQGWISLPIIALLIALSSLSMQFQEKQLASYLWQGHVAEVTEEQSLWADFQKALVLSPSFALSVLSECIGFCDLQVIVSEQTWQSGDASLRYRWERYESLPNEDENLATFYRLCATQNQQQYRCWWWQENRLLSNGWVSASD